MAGRKKPDSVDVYVGARVRARRAQINISQETLGKRLGLTFQQVQKYEKGANRISASRLVQIANALKMPVAWFFKDAPGCEETGNGDGFANAAYTKFIAEQNGMKLMANWAVATASERSAVQSLLRDLVNGRAKK